MATLIRLVKSWHSLLVSSISCCSLTKRFFSICCSLVILWSWASSFNSSSCEKQATILLYGRSILWSVYSHASGTFWLVRKELKLYHTEHSIIGLLTNWFYWFNDMRFTLYLASARDGTMRGSFGKGPVKCSDLVPELRWFSEFYKRGQSYLVVEHLSALVCVISVHFLWQIPLDIFSGYSKCSTERWSPTFVLN